MSDYVGGPGIVVSGGMPNVYTTGIIRWNGSAQRKEVMSGDTWIPLQDAIGNIMLSPDVLDVVAWAKKKMIEEAELVKLCAEHPGLKDVKEKFDIMLALVKEQK